MPRLLLAFKAALLALFLTALTPSHAADDVIKTVYHMSEGIPQASRAINNIRNHLAADPKAKIVVVTHGLGIDFLLEGATNQMEQPFAGAIGELAAKGVEFRVCNNTLVSRKIDGSKVVMEAKIVPSGVAEVARLQAREGFVYLRP
ncbi:DsrE family protein [Hydrogenophaga pseudoflava]|uniref:DsrE family protein n=1 Tax=Hydrogenophaga pseudoflava TaxID=47421 RepID=UPI0027E429FD|nr:DsrE family protein [Hydrogenophaga pseudoflava]MDQ7745027.1 DsrE family protein [Hydrogenophaga pseudoflava]